MHEPDNEFIVVSQPTGNVIITNYYKRFKIGTSLKFKIHPPPKSRTYLMFAQTKPSSAVQEKWVGFKHLTKLGLYEFSNCQQRGGTLTNAAESSVFFVFRRVSMTPERITWQIDARRLPRLVSTSPKCNYWFHGRRGLFHEQITVALSIRALLLYQNSHQKYRRRITNHVFGGDDEFLIVILGNIVDLEIPKFANQIVFLVCYEIARTGDRSSLKIVVLTA